MFKLAWIQYYMQNLPRVKLLAGFVMFVTFGVMFLTMDTAAWAERKFVSVTTDGAVHDSVTWSFPAAITALAALVFLSGASQMACGPMYMLGEGRNGVDISGAVEALGVEPTVLATLAVAAGVPTLSTIIVIVLVCFITVALMGAAKLVRFLLNNNPASVRDSGGDGAAVPRNRPASRYASLADLLFDKVSSLPWVFSAMAVGTRVVIYGVVVQALVENADDAAAKTAAGISGTTIAIIAVAFVAMLMCDLYVLADVAWKRPSAHSIPHAHAHSFLHTVRFLVTTVVVVGLGTAVLTED